MLLFSKQLKNKKEAECHACGKSELTKASQLCHHKENSKSEEIGAPKYYQIPKPAGPAWGCLKEFKQFQR